MAAATAGMPRAMSSTVCALYCHTDSLHDVRFLPLQEHESLLNKSSQEEGENQRALTEAKEIVAAAEEVAAAAEGAAKARADEDAKKIAELEGQVASKAAALAASAADHAKQQTQLRQELQAAEATEVKTAVAKAVEAPQRHHDDQADGVDQLERSAV